MPGVTADLMKIPPHDIVAEKSVLGAIMIDSSSLTLVAETLKQHHFYTNEHQTIYGSMISLFEKQHPIDLVTLKNELQKEGNLKKIGGASYLSDLINTVPTSAYIEHYANIVKAHYSKRKLIELSSRMVERAFSDTGDAKMLLDEAESEIFALNQENVHRDFIPLKSILSESFERLEEFAKMVTSFGECLLDLEI
jgi:replicative DNA helicase